MTATVLAITGCQGVTATPALPGGTCRVICVALPATIESGVALTRPGAPRAGGETAAAIINPPIHALAR